MMPSDYRTPRNEQTGQVLIEGIHDITVMGISLLGDGKLSLRCSQGHKIKELYVQGSQHVMIFGEGLILPCIVGQIFLNPPKDHFLGLIPETVFGRLYAESSCYLEEQAWTLVVTASYGDGFVIMGSGLQPQVYW